jgi:hypothetical protein
MGLFDTVTCRYPLPDAAHQDLEYQTKDLECLLEHFTISADGRLVRHDRRSGVEPGCDVEWPIHRDVRIYAADPRRERGLVEYVLRFTHGRVEWVQRRASEGAPQDTPPTAPREPPLARGDSPARSGLTSAAEGSPVAAHDRRRDDELELIASLHRGQPELVSLLAAANDHWGFEDPVYRFYHQSFKVYWLQERTLAMVEALASLLPQRALHPWFVEIVDAGTGRVFSEAHNADWACVTRPILEAFFHARFFVEMAVRYAGVEEPPSTLPSGYAALLEVYGLR